MTQKHLGQLRNDLCRNLVCSSIMREYEPIWNKLKATKQVSITANRALHPRIVKAVKKEKWKDLGYKLQIEPRIATLSHSTKGSVITFFLTFNLISQDF